MTNKNFKRISRGYREGFDCVGFGWFIEKADIWGDIWYCVYKTDECRFDDDGYVETPALCFKKFETLKEAKAWCKDNTRQ
jgi:hypothetical protein